MRPLDRYKRYVDQTCVDCGVSWWGPPSRDGLCGSNCRAIRAEIRSELGQTEHLPRVHSVSIYNLAGATPELFRRYAGRCFQDVGDFDEALLELRKVETYVVHVWASLRLTNGDEYDFRPDQYGAYHSKRCPSTTLAEHFCVRRSMFIELADKGDPVLGLSPAQLSELAEQYGTVLEALGN